MLHFILTGHWLSLSSHLFLHGFHGELLAGLEGLKAFFLSKLGCGLSCSGLVISWEFTLLSGHDELSELWVLSHRLHGHLELLHAGLGKEFKSLLHDDLALLVLLHELFLNNFTVLIPLFIFEVHATLILRFINFGLSSLFG